MMPSELEAVFALQLQALGVPGATREYKFLEGRRFRFDFCWPDRMFAVELEGGTWAGGRHTRGAGFKADCEKLNLAVLAGWRVLRYTADSIHDWSAAHEVAEVLK
jgi:very-short-patch-repair endonuclease